MRIDSEVKKLRHKMPFFGLVLTGLMVAAVEAQAAPTIINGEDVVPADPLAATTVAIRGKNPANGKGYLCSGSVLAPDLIITAGHCLLSEVADLKIRFGVDAANPVAERQVTGKIRPDNYSEYAWRDMHDVALLSFDGGLPEGFEPVELMPEGMTLQKGDAVLLAGFGINVPQAVAGQPTGSGTLRKVNVTIRNPDYGKSEVELDETTGGSCGGDSGGPAFLVKDGKVMLFGVTSRGPSPCAGRGIYTHVIKHMAFITEASEQLRKP